jgi:DNA-binding HxlR family transcriptional regulator
MKGTSQVPSPCVTHGLLEILARLWTMHILWSLATIGPQRFGALRRQIEGISSRVLTGRLRSLETQGFVFRHCGPTIPPAVTYGITNRMKDIENVLRGLDGLSHKWQAQEASSQLKAGSGDGQEGLVTDTESAKFAGPPKSKNSPSQGLPIT